MTTMDDPATRERELMDLLSAAWDDRLDAASRRRLEELLSLEDFAGTRVLADFTRLHIDLEWLMSSKAAQRKALDAVARAKRGQARIQAWELPAKPVIGLAAAILLLLAAAWHLGWRGNSRGSPRGGDVAAAPMERPSLPVGRVVGQAGVRWGEERALRDGQSLLKGQVIDLVAGTSRISMDAGVEIVVQSPCRATLISSDMVALESGKIAVKVADWGSGFKVRTNDLLVTDIGTRFMVHVDAQSRTEVHVHEGLVVTSALKKSGATRMVGAAQAVRVDAEGALDAVAFRREAFVDALERFQPLRSIELANTGVGLRVGEHDEHWLITAGDSRYGPYPQRATVCAAAAGYGSNDPARSQWISVKEGTTRGVPVRTKYTFETAFDLTGYDVNSVCLTGLVLADNGVEEIRLNGRPLPIAPWYDWSAEVTFQAFHTIEITGGFVPGKNVLSIEVVNATNLAAPEDDADLPPTPNPMALRVEWRGSGRPR
jgi:ferric-dicitrate binding protein FerR (iron transport regulator)